MRVAIIHDWLVTWAGAEQVLERLLLLHPGAEIFTLIDALPREFRHRLHGARVHTSWMQRLPGIAERYRQLLPVMPQAIEAMDLRGFDLVISNSHAIAKGVRVPRGVPHVCYCLTPMRYAWDLREAYLTERGWSPPVRWLADRALDRMQRWDRRTADGITAFGAISAFVAARISRCYGRESQVVFPPVDVAAFTPGGERGAHFVTAGRLVLQKRVDLMVDAMRQRPHLTLHIIGDGPERPRLERGAPDNVRFLGRLPDTALRDELRRARAFLFASEEDFGIAPLEAQACGTPVIACGVGAVRETLQPLGTEAPTAVFFPRQDVGDLIAAIDTFLSDGAAITADACRRNAERFTVARFDAGLRALVASAVAHGGQAAA